jgi:hypothetical protein
MGPINRRERCDGSGFRFEITTPKCRLGFVLRAFAHLCRHLPLSWRSRRGAAEPRRSARLASYMTQHNRARLDTDLRDAALQGRRLVKNLFRLALLAGGAWVAVESAKAFSIF